jgi:hypothetical protein
VSISALCNESLPLATPLSLVHTACKQPAQLLTSLQCAVPAVVVVPTQGSQQTEAQASGAEQAAASSTKGHSTLNAHSCGVAECVGKRVPGGRLTARVAECIGKQVPSGAQWLEMCPSNCMQYGGPLNAYAGWLSA